MQILKNKAKIIHQLIAIVNINNNLNIIKTIFINLHNLLKIIIITIYKIIKTLIFYLKKVIT